MRSSDTASAVSRQAQLASASSAPRRGSEYVELSRQVKEAGLLERRPGYYAWKIAVTVGLRAAGWTVFVVVGNSWWQLAVAAFLAVIFTQIGFLGHDARHRQVFGTRRASYVAGVLLGNLGIGLSYGWWVDKHNRHHAHPNTEDADPDIAVGALAFSQAQARASRGLARLLFRYQAYLFFPLLLLEAVNWPKATRQVNLTHRRGVPGAAEGIPHTRTRPSRLMPVAHEAFGLGRPQRCWRWLRTRARSRRCAAST